MALLDWNASLSVDVAEMDEEHRKWFALVNNLDEAMKQGRTRDEMDRALTELARYTQAHFASEEAFMARIGYPHLGQQNREHAELMKQLALFKVDFDAGRAFVSLKLMGFLRDWLRNHIQRADRQYGVWAKESVGV